MADDSKSSHVRTDSGELSDAELVRASREGSRRAYATLWDRHSASAVSYARTLTIPDADDIVSEAFMKVYIAIKAGRGPEDDFRYYLRSAVRNTYISMVRARRTIPAGDAFEQMIGDDGAEAASLTRFDGSATARAFVSLPTRWQEVLWYTEVENLPREHTATLLGMNANAVSALAFRAREALRTAWLQQHVSSHPDLDPACEAIASLLGAHSRRGLSRRDRLRVEQHLNGCARCTSVAGELSQLLKPGRLAIILLPVLVGSGGVAAYTSKFAVGTAATASASTPFAVTVVGTVSGSSAASGGLALAIVGKVAACALVAGVIAAPVPALINAAADSPPASHTISVRDLAADTALSPGSETRLVQGSSESDPGLSDRARVIPAGDDADEAASPTDAERVGAADEPRGGDENSPSQGSSSGDRPSTSQGNGSTGSSGNGPGANSGNGPSANSGSGPSANSGSGPSANSGSGPSSNPGNGPSANSGSGPSSDSGNGPTASQGNGPNANSGNDPASDPGNGQRASQGNGPANGQGNGASAIQAGESTPPNG